MDTTVVAGLLSLQARAGNAAVSSLVQEKGLNQPDPAHASPGFRPRLVSPVAGLPSNLHVQRVLKIDGKKVKELPGDEPALVSVKDEEVLARLRSWATSFFTSHSYASWPEAIEAARQEVVKGKEKEGPGQQKGTPEPPVEKKQRSEKPTQPNPLSKVLAEEASTRVREARLVAPPSRPAVVPPPRPGVGPPTRTGVTPAPGPGLSAPSRPGVGPPTRTGATPVTLPALVSPPRPAVGPPTRTGVTPAPSPGLGAPSVARPPGRPSAPKPLPAYALAVADLYSLDLAGMAKAWAPVNRPAFEDYIAEEWGHSFVRILKWYAKVRPESDVPDEYEGEDTVWDADFLSAIPSTLRPTFEDQAKLLHVDVAAGIRKYKDDKTWEPDAADLMYIAFQWSNVKQGVSPVQRPMKQSSFHYEFDTKASDAVTKRVYVNTDPRCTEQVAKELSHGTGRVTALDRTSCAALKYAVEGAERRDAIVIYVAEGLDGVLRTIGQCQQANPRCFVNESVRLTRSVQGLPGVGIAEHPSGAKSYSQLASGAVLAAKREAGSLQEFAVLLRSKLEEAGLDPDALGSLKR